MALTPGDLAVSQLHRTVLASLPARFALAAEPPADIQLVSGDEASWHQRARSALAAGAPRGHANPDEAATAVAVRQFSHAGKRRERLGFKFS